jgi:hypothetical protein
MEEDTGEMNVNDATACVAEDVRSVCNMVKRDAYKSGSPFLLRCPIFRVFWVIAAVPCNQKWIFPEFFHLYVVSLVTR